MSLDPFFRSSFGVRHYWRDDGDGNASIVSFQDTDDILEHNKAQATHNDGYNPDRTMRRVASIPMVLIHHWLVTEGWNALDPACADKLKQKLNDPEYRYLRTAPGRF